MKPQIVGGQRSRRHECSQECSQSTSALDMDQEEVQSLPRRDTESRRCVFPANIVSTSDNFAFANVFVNVCVSFVSSRFVSRIFDDGSRVPYPTNSKTLSSDSSRKNWISSLIESKHESKCLLQTCAQNSNSSVHPKLSFRNIFVLCCSFPFFSKLLS